MAIQAIVIDTWLSHLLFNRPKLIEGQLVDGLWYGNLGVVGDASAGIVDILGQISFARKEDWLYQLVSWSLNRANTTPVRWQIGFPSGPAIQTPVGIINNPFYSSSFITEQGASGLSANPPSSGGLYKGQFLFGDKKIEGNYTMVNAICLTNTTGIAYQVSLSGFLYRYSDFFRGPQAVLA